MISSGVVKRIPHNFKNLLGERFGRLTVIGKAENANEHVMWTCQCDCGSMSKVSSQSLRSGNSSSCGCIRKEMLVGRITKHGQARERDRNPIYTCWAGMKARCFNSNELAYKNYGGRGITVCNEWLNFEPFYRWAISSGYKHGLEIDRINNNGNYEPSNCRWVTDNENRLNTRRNRLITINNETKPVTIWSQESGITRGTIYSRIRYGWAESDLLKPVGLYEKNKSRKRDSNGRFY